MEANEIYDVVIVGGGPAGLQCTRNLCKKGYKVILLERSKIPGEPNYSTAGVLANVLKDYELSQGVAGDYYKEISFIANDIKGTWSSEKTIGYVLNFSKTKNYLSLDITNNGGRVQYGSLVTNAYVAENGTVNYIEYEKDGKKYNVFGKYFVDATAETGIIGVKIGIRKQKMGYPGIGEEFIIKAHLPDFYKHNIIFYFGKKYIKHGYAWVFAFGENTYKVGVCLADYGKYKNDKSLKDCINTLLQTLDIKDYEIIENHGGTIYVTGGQYKNTHKNVICIGDTTSSINALVGEGVRHALYSGELAGNVLDETLKGKIHGLDEYDKRLKKYRSYKWRLSRIIASIIYHHSGEKMLSFVIKTLNKLNLKEALYICADYKFGYFIKALFMKN